MRTFKIIMIVAFAAWCLAVARHNTYTDKILSTTVEGKLVRMFPDDGNRKPCFKLNDEHKTLKTRFEAKNFGEVIAMTKQRKTDYFEVVDTSNWSLVKSWNVREGWYIPNK